MAKPSTALEVVAPEPGDVDPTLKAKLPELAAQIRDTHALGKRHAQLAMAFAVRLGLLCDEAKEKLGHKEFEPWLKAHGIEKTKAYRTRLLARSAMMQELPAKELMAPDFVERVEKDQAYRAAVAAKVKDVAGEATVTEVMTDLGILQRPANVDDATGKRKHYPAAPKETKKSREQIEKENRAAARKMFINAFAAVRSATNNKPARRFLLAPDWVFIAKLAKDQIDALNKIAAQAQAALAKGKK